MPVILPLNTYIIFQKYRHSLYTRELTHAHSCMSPSLIMILPRFSSLTRYSASFFPCYVVCFCVNITQHFYYFFVKGHWDCFWFKVIMNNVARKILLLPLGPKMYAFLISTHKGRTAEYYIHILKKPLNSFPECANLQFQWLQVNVSIIPLLYYYLFLWVLKF
jgi:hypothetical protein